MVPRLVYRAATELQTVSQTMSKSTTAHEIMEREFLETRAKLLELAAALDRLDRAAGSVAQDPRSQQIQ